MANQQRKQYHSVPLRAQAQAARSRATQAQPTTDEVDIPGISRLDTRMTTPSHIPHTALPFVPDDDRRQGTPKSTVWMTDAQGRPVVRRGNQQMVIHKKRRSLHWLLYIGLGMAIAMVLYTAWEWGSSAIQQNDLNSAYGMPRTYQCDAVVGHEDSPQHPTHFIFENLDGHILIIELPGGNIKDAHIYGGPTIYTPGGSQVPVTGSFRDINHDGRLDMLVIIGTGSQQTTITFVNNGTLFVPQP